MMMPNMTLMLITMMMILVISMSTTKTSIMCINLILYIAIMSLIMSMKMKLTPIPYIIFLTMIGGLMIIFLYLAATLWTKKETLSLKPKIVSLLIILISAYPLMTTVSQSSSNNKIYLFNPPHNKMILTVTFLITIMLVFTIEIHMKANSPFRRKLKIWE